MGGIPYGSNNDEIYLTSCEIVGTPEEMPTPAPIVWGTQVPQNTMLMTLSLKGTGKAYVAIRCLKALPLSIVRML